MRRNWMLILVAGIGLAGCQTYGNDEMARYLQRKDGVTLGAGDASSQRQCDGPNAASVAARRWPTAYSRWRVHGLRARCRLIVATMPKGAGPDPDAEPNAADRWRRISATSVFTNR
jgi:hypothetical protein